MSRGPLLSWAGAKWYRSQWYVRRMRVLLGWLRGRPARRGRRGAVAIASPQFSSTFALTFSSATPGAPSGLDVIADVERSGRR